MTGLAFAQERLHGLQEIDRPFLTALVGQQAHDRDVVVHMPASPCLLSSASGTFRKVDAQPLQNDLVRADAEVDDGLPFSFRLRENQVRLPQEPLQLRCRVGTAGRVVRVGGIAQVKKGREDKGHSPQTTQAAQRKGEARRRETRKHGPRRAALYELRAARHMPGQIGLQGMVRHCQGRLGRKERSFRK